MRKRRRNHYRAVLHSRHCNYPLALATSVATRAATAHAKIDAEITIGDYNAMSELHANIQDSPAIRDLLAAKVAELESALGWRS